MTPHRFGRIFRSGILFAVAGAFVALASGCTSASTLPGTALGTYDVTGTLGTNTCGSNLGAPSTWTFTVQMSKDGSTLYWETTDGARLSSTMASATKVDLTSTTTANADAADGGAEGACDLQSTTTIDLTLATSSPPATLTGSITYTFSASTGASTTTDCTDQLSASGGTYDTLPCTAAYSITGTHTSG